MIINMLDFIFINRLFNECKVKLKRINNKKIEQRIFA
jgi:hypothetical protein